MKLRESNFKLETNGEFSTTDFKIEGKYKNKVLWMLINQYRYKVRTPVQEIVSNARDAQRENGNPDTPIKIQLPTRLEPTFKVRDYGVGMNEERIKTIFTSFGASTKNSDNTQTGGFGIGAKSPLTYTDQFNIKTYVDGTFWYYVVAKTDNDGIAVHLLSKGETDEPNGTEVQIPVNPNDRDRFIKSACRCTMFWDVSPNFNLPEEELYNHINGIYLDNVSIHTNNELGGLFSGIVLSVDGIPYQLDNDTLREVKTLQAVKNKLRYGAVAVIKLNVGDIDLLQTRESIEETENTITQLKKIGLKALTEVEQYIDSCLTDNTLQGRIQQYRNLTNKFDGINEHDFAKVFTLNSNVLYVPHKLNFSGYAYKGKWGARVTTPQKKNDKFFSNYSATCFKYDELNSFYWDDIKDGESDTIKNRRLRHALIQKGSGQVVVINKGTASNFEYVRTVRMLGAKPLSSLELPPKVKRTSSSSGTRTKKSDEVITIHELYNCGTRSSKDIKLSENTTKFVYGDYQENMDSKWIKFIKNYTEFTPVLLSKTIAKKVKGDTSFTTLEDFKSSYTLSEKLIKNYSVTKFNTYKLDKDINKILGKSIGNINDKVLVGGYQLLKSYSGEYDSDINNLPSEVSEKLEKITESKRFTVACIYDRLMLRLDRYPMIKFIELEERSWRNVKENDKINKPKIDAITNYINNTYRANKRSI